MKYNISLKEFSLQNSNKPNLKFLMLLRGLTSSQHVNTSVEGFLFSVNIIL